MIECFAPPPVGSRSRVARAVLVGAAGFAAAHVPLGWRKRSLKPIESALVRVLSLAQLVRPWQSSRRGATRKARNAGGLFTEAPPAVRSLAETGPLLLRGLAREPLAR